MTAAYRGTPATDHETAPDNETGPDQSTDIDTLRVGRLMRGLRGLGLVPGQSAVVFTADAMSMDTRVGMRAAQELPLRTRHVQVPDDDERARQSARLLVEEHPEVILACARGVEILRSVGARGLIVGDGPGVRWWRAVELREGGSVALPRIVAGVRPFGAAAG